jgi:hypothetical protein
MNAAFTVHASGTGCAFLTRGTLDHRLAARRRSGIMDVSCSMS